MNYTTIEQSKKLLELGLSPDTADMLWEQHTFESPYVTVKPWTTKGKSIDAHIIPCWSLGALMELISNYVVYHIRNNKTHITFYCTHRITSTPTHSTNDYNSEIDAAFEMIVWLLENGYIKKLKRNDTGID